MSDATLTWVLGMMWPFMIGALVVVVNIYLKPPLWVLAILAAAVLVPAIPFGCFVCGVLPNQFHLGLRITIAVVTTAVASFVVAIAVAYQMAYLHLALGGGK